MPVDSRPRGGEGASPTAAQGLPPPLASSPVATPRDPVCALSQNVALPGVVVWWRPGPRAQADQSLLDVYRHYLQRRILMIAMPKNKAVG